MEYTIQKLGKLAGISTRTLRYYDEIELLKPARINSSGYRIYGGEEVGRLQQILFYRELGVDLMSIKRIITSPSFNGNLALKEHREKLIEKRKQLDALIENVEKTIEFTEGRIKMSDKEKFEGFKQKMIEENEKRYGKEIRNKYGNHIVESSYSKVKGMSEEEFERANKLEEEFKKTLEEAYQTGDPAGSKAQKAAELHKNWLSCYWSDYSREAHAGLARLYAEDPRFTAYYDKNQPGTTAFLRDAIIIYTEQNK